MPCSLRYSSDHDLSPPEFSDLELCTSHHPSWQEASRHEEVRRAGIVLPHPPAWQTVR